MMHGDPSTLRFAAANALVSVADRGDEAAKAALLERLKMDSDWCVRRETSYSTPFEEEGQREVPCLPQGLGNRKAIRDTDEKHNRGKYLGGFQDLGNV
eukprot:2737875-Amphidinium_carterae.1